MTKGKSKTSSNVHRRSCNCFPARWINLPTGACVWGNTTWTPPWTFPQRRNATWWMASSATRGSSTKRIPVTSPMTSPWCIWPSLWKWQRRSAPSACPHLGMWWHPGHPASSPAGETRKVEGIVNFNFLQWSCSRYAVESSYLFGALDSKYLLTPDGCKERTNINFYFYLRQLVPPSGPEAKSGSPSHRWLRHLQPTCLLVGQPQALHDLCRIRVSRWAEVCLPGEKNKNMLAEPTDIL